MLLHRRKPTILLRLLRCPIRSRHAAIAAAAGLLLGSLLRRLTLHVLDCLLVWDRQRVNAEVLADGARHEDRPPEVHDHREDEVSVQVGQLNLGADGGEAQAWQVSEDGAADKWEEHDGPVREGLARQVCEDHLSSHATKDEAHGQAE